MTPAAIPSAPSASRSAVAAGSLPAPAPADGSFAEVLDRARADVGRDERGRRDEIGDVDRPAGTRPRAERADDDGAVAATDLDDRAPATEGAAADEPSPPSEEVPELEDAVAVVLSAAEDGQAAAPADVNLAVGGDQPAPPQPDAVSAEPTPDPTVSGAATTPSLPAEETIAPSTDATPSAGASPSTPVTPAAVPAERVAAPPTGETAAATDPIPASQPAAAADIVITADQSGAAAATHPSAGDAIAESASGGPERPAQPAADALAAAADAGAEEGPQPPTPTPGTHAPPAAAVSTAQEPQATGPATSVEATATSTAARLTGEPARTASAAGQVATAVAALQRQGDGEYSVNIELHPAELGRVRVKVNIVGGVVDVSLAAEQGSTRSLVSSQLEQLRTTLADAGLRAGTLDVSDRGFGQDAEPRSSGEGDTGGGPADERRGGPWRRGDRGQPVDLGRLQLDVPSDGAPRGIDLLV